MRKLNGMTEAALKPERYGADNAEILLIIWGSTVAEKDQQVMPI